MLSDSFKPQSSIRLTMRSQLLHQPSMILRVLKKFKEIHLAIISESKTIYSYMLSCLRNIFLSIETVFTHMLSEDREYLNWILSAGFSSYDHFFKQMIPFQNSPHLWSISCPSKLGSVKFLSACKKRGLTVNLF